MAIFSRLRALGAEEWRVVLQCALLIPFVRARLRLLGLARLLGAREPARPPAAAAAGALPARRVAELVAVVANRPPFASTCLARSLVLERLLRRRGFGPELRIGVRMECGSLQAHAWIECDGQPLADSPDVASRYAAFDGPIPREAFGR